MTVEKLMSKSLIPKNINKHLFSPKYFQCSCKGYMVVFMYTQALDMNQIITNDIKRLEVFKINKEDMMIIVYIASTCTQKPE